MTNFFKPKLSKRLSHFQNFYAGQDLVWDIGCDHGHLGLSFIDHFQAPMIHLVDPAIPVIEKLQKKLIDSDIPRTSLFHQHGQLIKLDHNKSHCIFIAGMGGLEIIEILKNLLPQMKESDSLLISPHNKVLEVREFLRSAGEWLISEDVLFEAGIWYPHFLLGRSGQVCPKFGDAIFKTEIGQRYRLHLIGQLSKHRDTRSKEFLNFLGQF